VGDAVKFLAVLSGFAGGSAAERTEKTEEGKRIVSLFASKAWRY
jgi:hypothetical protein